MKLSGFVVALLVLGLAACNSGRDRRHVAPGTDAGGGDSARPDTSALDGSTDASPVDSGGFDGGPGDTGMPDTAPPDTTVTCVDGEHLCADACVSNDAPETCGARCTPCEVPPLGVATCVDEVCGFACPSGLNACGDACVDDVAAEALCDGGDDDCDGTVDEGCGDGSCATPWVVPAGGVSGETRMVTGGPTHGGSCTGSGGNGRVHRWTPTTSGTATVRYTNDFWPASLIVQTASCTGTEVGCDYVTTAWPTLTLSFTATAGTVYYIKVAHGSYRGTVPLTYDLTVTAPP